MKIEQVIRKDTISKKDFINNFLLKNIPLVFRNERFHETEMAKWNQDYLNDKWGDIELPIQVYPAGGRAIPHEVKDRDFRKITMREFFKQDQLDPEKKEESLLLGKISSNLFPEMEEQYHIPDIMPGKSFTDKVWIYSKSVTPLHYDITENLLHHACGRKRVIFFKPSIKKLYAYPFFSQTPHFSQVDLDNIDYEKFPLVKNETAYECYLEPGDIMYIPFGWWHQLWGLDQVNISVAHWFYSPLRKNFMCPEQAIRLYKMTFQRWLLRYPI